MKLFHARTDLTQTLVTLVIEQTPNHTRIMVVINVSRTSAAALIGYKRFQTNRTHALLTFVHTINVINRHAVVFFQTA